MARATRESATAMNWNAREREATVCYPAIIQVLLPNVRREENVWSSRNLMYSRD